MFKMINGLEESGNVIVLRDPSENLKYQTVGVDTKLNFKLDYYY